MYISALIYVLCEFRNPLVQPDDLFVPFHSAHEMGKLNGAEQAKASEIDFKHSSLPHWNISTAQLIRHFVCRLIDWTDNNNKGSNRSNKNSWHKL